MTMKSQRHPIHGGLQSSQSIASFHNKFIIDSFMRKFKFDLNNQCLEYDKKHFEKNLYLITTQFAPNQFSAKDAFSSYNSQPLFDSFKAWYLNTVHKVMGEKSRKQTKLQPFAISFLDVEGTAQGQAASVFQVPHLHTCLLTRPENQKKFEEFFLSQEPKLFKNNNIIKVEIQQFKDDGRGIEPMLTYASKYARQQIKNPRIPMLLQSYPDVDAKHYPFYNFKG